MRVNIRPVLGKNVVGQVLEYWYLGPSGEPFKAGYHFSEETGLLVEKRPF